MQVLLAVGSLGAAHEEAHLSEAGEGGRGCRWQGEGSPTTLNIPQWYVAVTRFGRSRTPPPPPGTLLLLVAFADVPIGLPVLCTSELAVGGEPDQFVQTS